MFRFTIRDVLWLTVVVALGVGWWLESSTPKSLSVSPYDLCKLCGPDEKVKITVYRIGWNADSPDESMRPDASERLVRISGRLIGR
jgi:hypothetical protein